jgi:hypothetical protein
VFKLAIEKTLTQQVAPSAPTPYKTKKAGIGTAIPRPADYNSAPQFIELCPLMSKMKNGYLTFCLRFVQ